ncbi:aldo/keto reductase [Azoarcus indigens]|uniref:Diketogulonate reductase-like aldo/keto reductase n=1 Tax=Azoarcus indigens TaxID=29545 RepID=A0A4R6DZR0_9RHOO|nr:aldo/keto reductase [Azoarcus indigens]NMG64719.1 aldo/keto reductase [Azoarcus indigens]TDN50896.1 diketogulonate reductase-like aldo/keto reductase [Azoarcus indigens]
MTSAHDLSPRLTRAQFLRLAAGTVAGLALPPGHAASPRPASAPADAADRPGKLLTRPIPATGEALPVIGCGTYIGFDAAPDTPEYQRLPAVLQTLFDAGGSVLDSSPMYGRAEATTGELLAASGSRKRAFIATKVWIRGRANGIRQMEDSLRLLQTRQLDLMQIHNLVDWRAHLATLRQWKEEQRVRYLGITHYTAAAYRELESVMRNERFDFLQINYSLDAREAEQRILPLAAERGMAVLINRPFGGGGLLRKLRDRPLPPWAADIGAASWAQLLLKFVLGHPAVTCAIPGTGRPEHMEDNVAAGMGTIPGPEFWHHHADLIEL